MTDSRPSGAASVTDAQINAARTKLIIDDKVEEAVEAGDRQTCSAQGYEGTRPDHQPASACPVGRFGRILKRTNAAPIPGRHWCCL